MAGFRSEHSRKLVGLAFFCLAAQAAGLLSLSRGSDTSLDTSREELRPEQEADLQPVLQPELQPVLQPELSPELQPHGYDLEMRSALQAAEMSLFYEYVDSSEDPTAEDESDVDSSRTDSPGFTQLINTWAKDNRTIMVPKCQSACDASKAECKEKACESKELKDPPFKRCAPQDAERPRMLYAKGCSGSTWVQKVGRELLRLHGYCVSPVAYEPLNPTSDVKRLFSQGNGTIGDSMERANEYWGKQGATFVYKGTGALDSTFVRKRMHKIGAYAAVVWRSNALDHAVCMVRDCFSDKLGYAVDENGKETQICFQRRKAPSAEGRSFKVKLNMTHLLRQIAYMSAQGQRLGEDLKASDFKDFNILTYEDLADYQRRDSQWTNGTEAFDRAVEAWGSFMRSWGVTPSYKTIADYLTAGMGSRDPPRLHSDTIYNYNEVKELIDRELHNWPEFQGLLRL